MSCVRSITHEQFQFCHLKGWKVKKILEYLDKSDFETEEVLIDFKHFFLIKMGSIGVGD